MNSSFHKTSRKLPLSFHPAVLFLLLALMLSLNVKGFSQTVNQPLAINHVAIEFANLHTPANFTSVDKKESPSQDDLAEDMIDLEADLAELESQIEDPANEVLRLENMIMAETDDIFETEDDITELEKEVVTLDLEEELIKVDMDVSELEQVIEDQAKELKKAYQEIEALKAMLEHTDLDLDLR